MNSPFNSATGFVCPKCNRPNKNKDHFNLCFFCGMCERWLTNKNRHLSVCGKDKTIPIPTPIWVPCPECKVEFNASGLSRHRRTAHGVEVRY